MRGLWVRFEGLWVRFWGPWVRLHAQKLIRSRPEGRYPIYLYTYTLGIFNKQKNNGLPGALISTIIMPSPKPLPPMTRTSLQEGHYTTTLLEESLETTHMLPKLSIIHPEP